MEHAKSSIREKIDRLNKRIDAQLQENHRDNKQDDLSYPGFDIADKVSVKQTDSNAIIQAYLNRDVRIDLNNLPARFRDLPSTFKTEKTDFTDLELALEPAMQLTALSDEDTCKLGAYVFPMLATGVSRQAIGVFLLLAFQLKTPGIKSTQRLFPEVIDERFNTKSDIYYANLEGQRLTIMGEGLNVIASGDITTDAKSYSFLAASMLRMFTTAPENYGLAWDHINKGFPSFYSKNISVTGIKPNLEVLKTIHRQFAFDPLIKSTLFRILYHANDTEKHDSIKKFLFDIHLSHTGMHILRIVLQLCVELNCSSGLVLACLWGGEFNKQINSLEKLLGFVKGGDPRRKRVMWRYGRIFEQGFMLSLQTRTCPKLVYILAAALRSERPENHAGILNIAKLKDLSEDDKRRCALAGDRLKKIIRMSVNREQEGLISTNRASPSHHPPSHKPSPRHQAQPRTPPRDSDPTPTLAITCRDLGVLSLLEARDLGLTPCSMTFNSSRSTLNISNPALLGNTSTTHTTNPSTTTGSETTNDSHVPSTNPIADSSTVRCTCGWVAPTSVVRYGWDVGRRYYKCRNYICGFNQWIDEPLPRRAVEYIMELDSENRMLRDQLHSAHSGRRN